jgi:hypothetical protein
MGACRRLLHKQRLIDKCKRELASEFEIKNLGMMQNVSLVEEC